MRGRGPRTEAVNADWVKNAECVEKVPLPSPSDWAVKGNTASFPVDSGRLKTKIILVLSKHHRTPPVADFTRFQSDRKCGIRQSVPCNSLLYLGNYKNPD